MTFWTSILSRLSADRAVATFRGVQADMANDVIVDALVHRRRQLLRANSAFPLGLIRYFRLDVVNFVLNFRFRFLHLFFLLCNLFLLLGSLASCWLRRGLFLFLDLNLFLFSFDLLDIDIHFFVLIFIFFLLLLVLASDRLLIHRRRFDGSRWDLLDTFCYH